MPRELQYAAQPLSTAAGRVIVSPFQFISSGEDYLRVTSFNALTGVRLKIQGRWIGERAAPEAFSHDHVPNSDRTERVNDYPLGIGAILNLVVFASAGAPRVGQTFVTVDLIRGLGAAAIVLGTLVQGYVTDCQALSWPGSPIQSSTSGEPYIRAVQGTTPAAGAPIAESVPTGARWELLSLFCTMTTSATAGTRRPFLQINQTYAMAVMLTEAAIGPSVVNADLTWQQGLPISSNATEQIYQAACGVNMILAAGGQIVVSARGIVGTDQLSAPTYLVREWLEGD